MEIPEIILQEALRSSYNCTAHEKLDFLLKKLQLHDVQELLLFKKSEVVNNIHIDIRRIVEGILFNVAQKRSGHIFELAQLIFTTRQFLQRGILKADGKEILAFLNVNCYLKLNLSGFLNGEELEEIVTIPLAEKIQIVLLKIQLQTVAKPDAPYNELKLLNDSEIAFKIVDLRGTYQLIESIERSGLGFHFNFAVENLIDFLFQLNYSIFLKTISALSHPQAFVFYIQSFKKEWLALLAGEITLKNKWLNFEIIRQAISKGKKNIIVANEYKTVKDSLSKIIKADFNFSKQVIQYFQNNLLLNAVIGEIAASMDDSQIQEIIDDCFKIDQYKSYVDERTAFLEMFGKHSTELKWAFLLQRANKKWNIYYQKCLNDEEFYHNELLLSDFANFIIQHHTLLLSNEELTDGIKNLIEKIKHIDSEWAISNSHQITKVNLYYSELYLLSCAYKNKKIFSLEIRNLFDLMKADIIAIKRFLSEKQMGEVNEISNNLNPAIP